MSAPPNRKDQARRLIKAAYAELDKALEHLADLEAMVDGNPTVGDQTKALTAAFAERWQARYKTEYHVGNWGKARTQLRALLKTLTADEITQRMDAYLSNMDRFYVTNRHPFDAFVKDINRFWQAPSVAGGRPVGCQHSPACDSDAAHTARKLTELRGY